LWTGPETEIDIYKTILSLRQQRSGCVQTNLQYKFVYVAVKRYIEQRKNAPVRHTQTHTHRHTSETTTLASLWSLPLTSTMPYLPVGLPARQHAQDFVYSNVTALPGQTLTLLVQKCGITAPKLSKIGIFLTILSLGAKCLHDLKNHLAIRSQHVTFCYLIY